MTYKLTAKITHRSFEEPIIHEFYYTGDSLETIVAGLETLDQHKYNLCKHKRTAFKDQRGVKHQWKIELMPELN